MKIAVVGLLLLAGVTAYLGCSSSSGDQSSDQRSKDTGSMTAHPVTEPTLPDSPQTATVEQEIAGDAQTEKVQEADVEPDDNKAEKSVPLVRRYPTTQFAWVSSSGPRSDRSVFASFRYAPAAKHGFNGK